MFKKPIEDLISGIVSIYFKTGNKELKVEMPQKKVSQNGVDNAQNINGENTQYDQQIHKKDVIKKTSQADKLPLANLPENYVFKNVLEEQEKSIKEVLDKSPYKREEILIRELASYQLATEYERGYHCIFKSQFDALQKLTETPEGLSINKISKA